MLAIRELVAGRLIAYLLFGLIVGILGTQIDSHWLNKAVGVGMIILSVVMLAFVMVKKWPHIGLCKLSKKYMNYPFLFGFLTGINVCPPFLLAMSAALSYASIAGSVLLFVGFFAGTSFYLILLVPLGFTAKVESIRLIGLITAVLSGVLFFVLGIWYMLL
jgi:sulfite exporter TauE/SafE